MNLSLAILPLVAQTANPPDAPAPVAPAPAPAPAIPAETSAVTTPTQSGLSAADTSALSAAAGPAPVSGPGAPLTPFLGQNLGSPYTSDRLPFRITATLGEAYNNNIFATPHKTFDYITRLGVQGELQLGNVLSVDGNYLDVFYGPTGRLYARHAHENGVDQDVDALYAHRWTRLTLSLEQIYTSIQSTNASIGGLVTSDVYTTRAQANFAYSQKLDVIGLFTQQFTDYDNPSYTDTKEWIGDIHALYHIDSKLAVGIGPRFGYLILKDAPDENFQQILAHAIYDESDKLHFTVSAGGEDREYQTANRSDTLEPIFEFAGVYLPYPSTNISVNAARRFTPSYGFVGQDYLATSVSLTATQRFFRAYYLGVAAGYENDDYEFVANGLTGPTREDNFFYIQPTLRWKPNGWLEVAAFDKYEEDDSNFTIFAYDANQFGVSFSATY